VTPAERQGNAAQGDSGASEGKVTLQGDEEVAALGLLYGELNAEDLAAIDTQVRQLPGPSRIVLDGVASALGLGLEPTD
jgi:hypothetical protein